MPAPAPPPRDAAPRRDVLPAPAARAALPPRDAAPTQAALLCGAYTLDALLSDAILAPLPPLVVLRDARLERVTALLADELSSPGPGEQTILDRALDLLLVLGLRAYFTQPGASVPGWYAALDDPTIAPAVLAMHADPRHRGRSPSSARSAACRARPSRNASATSSGRRRWPISRAGAWRSRRRR
ncbi:cupin domain-containing protein [Solirubrobacter soli]|uniref:cupin domain-containing protein n=1 Tax=Solirubrobacter soli TaxID=363832 RepID=UPI0009FE13B1